MLITKESFQVEIMTNTWVVCVLYRTQATRVRWSLLNQPFQPFNPFENIYSPKFWIIIILHFQVGQYVSTTVPPQHLDKSQVLGLCNHFFWNINHFFKKTSRIDTKFTAGASQFHNCYLSFPSWRPSTCGPNESFVKHTPPPRKIAGVNMKKNGVLNPVAWC